MQLLLSWARDVAAWHGRQIELDALLQSSLQGTDRFDSVVELLRVERLLPPEVPTSAWREQYETFRGNVLRSRELSLGRFDGRTVLVRGRGAAMDHGWRAHASDLTIMDLDAGHYEMLTPEAAATVARALGEE
jgi:thioesterase domain-containing protein